MIPAGEPQYFGNPLNQFENGVQLDLRAKLAVEFLKANAPAFGPPEEAARYALDLAGELLKQSAERGWTKPLPEDDELPAGLRRHIRQNTRVAVYQQTAGQKIAQEEAPQVQQANGLGPFVGRN